MWHVCTHQAFDESLLITSFTWCPSLNSEDNPVMAVTLSNSSIHLLVFQGPLLDSMSVSSAEQAINDHAELEAWTSVFAIQENGGVRVYSGGDDAKLRVVELQALPKAADEELSIVQTLPQTEFRGHEAGVTAILPLPLPSTTYPSVLGDVLLTGSYDCYFRVYTTYDQRSNQRPVGKAMAELKLDGGVWRLKFLDDPPIQNGAGLELRFRVLASCMHAGARVLEVKRSEAGEWAIEVMGEVNVHESMCYGSDVQPGGQRNGERLCVSTSFYDKLLCVWRYDPESPFRQTLY
jgi:diphthamide biosynthesis protein 7